MFCPNSRNDLSRISRKLALFSTDPFFLHFPRQRSRGLSTQETRMHGLEKKSSRLLGIRIMLTSLAVLFYIYIHLPGHHAVSAAVLIAGFSLCLGATTTTLHIVWIKRQRKRKANH